VIDEAILMIGRRAFYPKFAVKLEIAAVSEPRAVATGSKVNSEKNLQFSVENSIRLRRTSHPDPVATARGSDTNEAV